MSFFGGPFDDIDVNNSFDRMFDFNMDGKLDIGEQACQMDFIFGVMEDEKKANSALDDDDDNDFNDFDGDF